MITLRHAAVSHQGSVRSNNEDSYHEGRHLIAVADGVGGAAAGEVASGLLITAVKPLDTRHQPQRMLGELRQAIESGGDRIRQATSANPEFEGMATTLTALLFSGERAALAHVGDSRAYRVRAEDVTQLTRDDTYVQLLVDKGTIKPEETFDHPQKSLVMRVLQGEPVEVTYGSLQVRIGDRYMLCSDGLTDAVPIGLVEETLRNETEPLACAQRLVEQALEYGGPDNVTVVVADVVDEPAPRDKERQGVLWMLLPVGVLAVVGLLAWWFIFR